MGVINANEIPSQVTQPVLELLPEVGVSGDCLVVLFALLWPVTRVTQDVAKREGIKG